MRCVHVWSAIPIKDGNVTVTAMQCIRCQRSMVQSYASNWTYEHRHPELKPRRLALAEQIRSASC